MNRRTPTIAASLVFVAVSVLWLWAFQLDTAWNRRRVSHRIDDLVQKINADPCDSGSIAALLELTQSDYSFEATKAVIGFGCVDAATEQCIQRLAALMESVDPFIARAAARSLANLGVRSESALPQLVRQVAKPVSDQVSWFAAEAIGKMGPAAVEFLPLLKSRLGTGAVQFDDSLRRAINRLEEVAPEADGRRP